MLAKSRWTYPPLYQQNIEDMRSSFIVIEQLFQDNQTVQYVPLLYIWGCPLPKELQLTL